MKTWAQAELDELISCPKRVEDPPRKTMRLDRGHMRNDLTLSSLDGERRYSVFMRINEHFPENFSIGLVYHPKDEPGELTLLRFNGPHGEHDNSPIDDPHPHFGFHIHTARADLMMSGFLPEKYAELTDVYASFPEALRQFVKVANITDAEIYFPSANQLSYFSSDEE